MTCHEIVDQDDRVVGHVCDAGPYEEIHRESIGQRWCFECRKRTEYFYVVTAPTDPMSWYGPTPGYKCGSCGKDGYCFPGAWIEWGDE